MATSRSTWHRSGTGFRAKFSLLRSGQNNPTISRLLELGRSHHLVIPALALSPLIVVTVAAIVFAGRLPDMDTLGYLGVLIANAVSSGTFVLPVPGLAVVFAAAALWNPVLVALAGATGSALGELTGYLAGAGSHHTVRRVMGRRRLYLRIEDWMRYRGGLTVFLLAAIPSPLFDLAGFASGSLGYPIKRFIIVCWLGKTAKFLVVAMVGSWAAPELLSVLGLE